MQNGIFKYDNGCLGFAFSFYISISVERDLSLFTAKKRNNPVIWKEDVFTTFPLTKKFIHIPTFTILFLGTYTYRVWTERYRYITLLILQHEYYYMCKTNRNTKEKRKYRVKSAGCIVDGNDVSDLVTLNTKDLFMYQSFKFLF